MPGTILRLLPVILVLAIPETAFPQEQRWEGVITLTHTFNGPGEQGGQVSWTREERWENFVVKAGTGDELSAHFDATWRVTDSRRDVRERCTYTSEASGEADYPWFSFQVNPLDEVTYNLASGGTGAGMADDFATTGTMTIACRDEPPGTLPYTVMASWLPAVPFGLTAELLEMLPPGIEIPQYDAAVSGPAITGTLDPNNPGWIQGSVTHRSDEGVTSTLTWDLVRPGGRRPDVRIAIEGPACGCMNAEDDEGRPLSFTATASVPGGTFGAFEVSASGEAPREITNQGGATPRLELAATPRTGRVTLSVTYVKDGRSHTAPGFAVSFCAMDSISLAAGGDEFSFDDSAPGRIAVDASGQAWLNGEQVSGELVWSLEEMGQGTTRVPEEDTGTSARLTYEGLPERNGAFGEKAIAARIQRDGCACERTKTIRIFYLPLASNHPHSVAPPGTPYSDTPNWFYYWTQSAAQQEIGMRHVRYVERIVDGDGRVVAAQYDETEDRVSLTDAVVLSSCQSRIDRTTRAPTGETSEGIDCFAETLRHEWQHRADWLAWWPSGAPGIWEGLVDDTDVDYVPSSVEEELPGCSDFEKRSCDDLPPINGITDREINAYWVGWTWPIGSADEDDWSCGGKQWEGGACPE